jgi:hypothetical protein
MHTQVSRRLVLLLVAAFAFFAPPPAFAREMATSLAQAAPKAKAADANRCISELKKAMSAQRIPPRKEPYEQAIDICKKTGDLDAAKAAVGAK